MANLRSCTLSSWVVEFDRRSNLQIDQSINGNGRHRVVNPTRPHQVSRESFRIHRHLLLCPHSIVFEVSEHLTSSFNSNSPQSIPSENLNHILENHGPPMVERTDHRQKTDWKKKKNRVSKFDITQVSHCTRQVTGRVTPSSIVQISRLVNNSSPGGLSAELAVKEERPSHGSRLCTRPQSGRKTLILRWWSTRKRHGQPRQYLA